LLPASYEVPKGQTGSDRLRVLDPVFFVSTGAGSA
jgi:hypothetical protein